MRRLVNALDAVPQQRVPAPEFARSQGTVERPVTFMGLPVYVTDRADYDFALVSADGRQAVVSRGNVLEVWRRGEGLLDWERAE